MRALRMNKRSVYYGMACMHCHKPISIGRVFLGSTYYVIPNQPWVKTHSMQKILDGLDLWNETAQPELRLRITYHRACLEGVLERGPLDREIEIAEWEIYRADLAERLGAQ